MSDASHIPEMVGRVARVIDEELRQRGILFKLDESFKIALAVLEAIKAPTHGMVEAGAEMVGDYSAWTPESGARETWRVMVEAALNEFP